MCTAQYKQVLEGCRFCLMCRHICTIGGATHREGSTPRGKALILFAAAKGIVPEDEHLAEAIYQCCQCGLCKEWCVSTYDHPGLVLDARKRLVGKGVVPSRVEAIRNDILERQTPYSPEQPVSAPSHSASASRTLLFMGCVGKSRYPDAASALARIMTLARDEWSTLKQEPCCGLPLYLLGFQDIFEIQARQVVRAIVESGVREVVTLCPSCYRAFSQLYPMVGAALPSHVKLVNADAYLKGVLGQGALSLGRSPFKTVTYHDSCQMARYIRDHETPRQVLQALPGVELVEMPFAGERARCCGAGSCVDLILPQAAQNAAADRLREAQETGAEALVTDCALCAHSFKSAGRQIPVYTVTEFVSSVLR